MKDILMNESEEVLMEMDREALEFFSDPENMDSFIRDFMDDSEEFEAMVTEFGIHKLMESAVEGMGKELKRRNEEMKKKDNELEKALGDLNLALSQLASLLDGMDEIEEEEVNG